MRCNKVLLISLLLLSALAFAQGRTQGRVQYDQATGTFHAVVNNVDQTLCGVTCNNIIFVDGVTYPASNAGLVACLAAAIAKSSVCDARGVTSWAGAFTTNPCAGITVPFTLHLPQAPITTNVPWVCGLGSGQHIDWPTTNSGVTPNLIAGASFPNFSVTNATRAANVMTYTVGSQPFAAGTFVVIGGVTDITMDMPCVVSSPTSTTFSCSNANSGSNGSSSGGIAAQPVFTIGASGGSSQDVWIENLQINAQVGVSATYLPTAFASQGTQEQTSCYRCSFLHGSRWAAINFLNGSGNNGNNTMFDRDISDLIDNGNHRGVGFLLEVNNSRNGTGGSSGPTRNVVRDFTVVVDSGTGIAAVEVQMGLSANIYDCHVEHVAFGILFDGNNEGRVSSCRDLNNVTHDVEIASNGIADPSILVEDVGPGSSNAVQNIITGFSSGTNFTTLYWYNSFGSTTTSECYVIQNSPLTCTTPIADSAITLFNGAGTITSAPASSAASTTGWKSCIFSNVYCTGLAAPTEYHLVPNWFSVGSANPANAGTSTVPDASAKASLGASGVLSLVPQAFASLPACGASLEGQRANVNNSTVATFGTTIVGGGANHVGAYCNGTNWVVD
jgi:hypothetical protein